MEPKMSPPSGTPPLLSQKQAAVACGVSPPTIRRARASGKLPNTVEDGNGGFLIPVTDLIAAGLMPSVTPPDSPKKPSVEELQRRIIDLEHQVVVERLGRQNAELLVEAKDKTLAMADLTMKALNASMEARINERDSHSSHQEGRLREHSTAAGVPVSEVAQPAARVVGWWRRSVRGL